MWFDLVHARISETPKLASKHPNWFHELRTEIFQKCKLTWPELELPLITRNVTEHAAKTALGGNMEEEEKEEVFKMKFILAGTIVLLFRFFLECWKGNRKS